MIEVSENIRKTAIEPLRHIPGASRRALVNGLNRSARAARTEVIGRITETYSVLFGAAVETLSVTPARKDRLKATVRSRGPATKLDTFPHTPQKPGTGGPGKPTLRANVKRLRTRTRIRGAFVIPTPSGKNIVVWRARGGGIRRVPALAIPYMASSEDVYQHVERVAREKLEERVAHEIAYELSKVRAKR